MSLSLTPNEAAFVAGRDVTAVQRAVDDGTLQSRLRTVRGRERRVLGRSEVRFFRATRGTEDTLTPKGRRALYEAIQRPRDGKASVGPFTIDLHDVDRQIDQGLAELNRIRSRVEPGPDGDPVLKGRRVPVHLLAALVEGGGVEEAMRAYPSLAREDVDAAVQYAGVYPKSGRPYPKRSLKRMLSELALPDEVFGDAGEEKGPREVRL